LGSKQKQAYLKI